MTEEQARAANRERQKRYRESHRAEMNDNRRERYEQRKADSKCPRCGGKAKKGHTLCDDCREYQGGLNQKYAQARRAAAPKKAVKAAAAKKPAKAKAAVKKPARAAAKKTGAKAKAVKKAVKK